MNIIDEILEQKRQIIEIDGMRYHSASYTLAALSFYALNKEKNASKGNFEDIRLARILSLFLLESKELVDEVHRDPIDYRKTLEEIADCAALLTGMTANIMHKIREEK